MSEGLEALERRQWQEAGTAFETASRLRPNAPEVADGLARVAAGERRDAIAAGIRLAADLEKAERWQEAEKTYTEILAIDPAAASALTGFDRSSTRSKLDEKLEYHLRNPVRLSSAKVFEEVNDLLDEARAVNPPGPRLEAQIKRLQEVVDVASRPIRVVIESDNLTDVVIYKVGRQGTFVRRELDLRPGTYTVVGSRDGFRDVRVQLQVTPNSSQKPVVVQCREAL